MGPVILTTEQIKHRLHPRDFLAAMVLDLVDRAPALDERHDIQFYFRMRRYRRLLVPRTHRRRIIVVVLKPEWQGFSRAPKPEPFGSYRHSE
jgi:hypothetical protein